MDWIGTLTAGLQNAIGRIVANRAEKLTDKFTNLVINEFDSMSPSQVHKIEDTAVLVLEQLAGSRHSRVSVDDIQQIRWLVQGIESNQ